MNRFFVGLTTGAMLLGTVAISHASVLKRAWGEEFGATW